MGDGKWSSDHAPMLLQALTAKHDGAAAASFSLLEGDGEEKKIFNKIAKIFIRPRSSTRLLAVLLGLLS
ncbi:hypothetical protein PTTG_28205 [Puccinia triticina 1-1 BBBD Race 1]|uniref:Uncharacterized protein n=1 Tax=Puccinia triticina (isolate 1-1 / race 1 (BBBD)) TaxID=630390 RepID=A0A180GDN2_PUCT1|nr:hypothetical protein PTTG_28205 [Puccinia triticina 1-1 BBBD Race 1]